MYNTKLDLLKGAYSEALELQKELIQGIHNVGILLEDYYYTPDTEEMKNERSYVVKLLKTMRSRQEYLSNYITDLTYQITKEEPKYKYNKYEQLIQKINEVLGQ